MIAVAPSQAMPAPIAVPVQPPQAATGAQAGSKSPLLVIAVIVSLVFAVCLAAGFFFFVRPQGSTDDARESADAETSQKDKPTPPSTAGRTAARTDPTTTTSSSPIPPVPNSKYRLLLKDGKYPFCVTSALKYAYPVHTDDNGMKVCSGTPDGPIPIDGLKKYDPSEFQWK